MGCVRAFGIAVLVALVVGCGGHVPPAGTPAAKPSGTDAQPSSNPAPLPPGRSIPAELSDREFWSLVTALSETDGTFRSDNLLSNELYMQYVIPQLTATVQPGGVYMGVGPEQNFTYIAATKPAMVFIVDIRRGNLDLQLLYKSLFELSHDRVDFVSRLFARRRPEGVRPDAPVNDIFQAVNNTPPDEQVFTANLQSVIDHLTKTRHLPLSAGDLEGIQYVYRAFDMFGPGLTYWSTGGSGGRMGRNAPTYWDLMMLTDESNVNWSYLASDANFTFMKQLEERNLIVPIVGDFAGPTAIRAVGEYLKARHATVGAFYLSNVEQYLNMDGAWGAFCENVAALPLDESSTFIRSVRAGQFGYGPGSLTSVLGKMLDETRACPPAAAAR